MVSLEIVDTLLGFIKSHWYRDAPPGSFERDRSRLLEWVVFEAAGRLDSSSVTLPGDRYLDIHLVILREAITHGGRPSYIPAYLRHVVQSHWKIHWERYYEQAKIVTPRIEECLRDLAAGIGRRPDPVREMVQARQLLTTRRREKAEERAEDRRTPPKGAGQMDLF